MGYILIKYIHLVAILVLFSTLVVEHLLVKSEMSSIDIKKVSTIDLIYGLSAGVVLIAGLYLWLFVGKPSAFYSSNPIFHIKLGLFVLAALISIYPTVFFMKK